MLEKSASPRLVWGPGAGAVAAGRLYPRRKRTGVAAHLSLPPGCLGVTAGTNPRRGLGIREDQSDGAGNGESHGKRHHAQARERSPRRRGPIDGRRVPDASHSHQGALARLKGQGLQLTKLPPRCAGDHTLW